MAMGVAGVCLCVIAIILAILGAEFWPVFTGVGLIFSMLGMLQGLE